MKNQILLAAKYARDAHAGQKRKYTSRPYITHPSRVAGVAATLEDATEELVVAAYLHDVVEDTPHSIDDIEESFGPEVAALVGELTNPSKGMTCPRAERKRIDREHLAAVSREAKLIKLLARIDNLREMAGASANFKRLYAEESAALAETIGDVDERLREELLLCIEEVLDPPGEDGTGEDTTEK